MTFWTSLGVWANLERVGICLRFHREYTYVTRVTQELRIGYTKQGPPLSSVASSGYSWPFFLHE